MGPHISRGKKEDGLGSKPHKQAHCHACSGQEELLLLPLQVRKAGSELRYPSLQHLRCERSLPKNHRCQSSRHLVECFLQMPMLFKNACWLSILPSSILFSNVHSFFSSKNMDEGEESPWREHTVVSQHIHIPSFPR